MTDETPNQERLLSGPDISPPAFAVDPHGQEWLRKLFPNYPQKEQIEQFFHVLGRAISLWQLVETALYEVYERAIAPKRPASCSASFHSIQTFEAKLRATDEAVGFSLLDDPDKLKEWKSLRKSASEKSQRRNQFVHFSTYIVYNAPNANDAVLLEPQVHDTRFITDRPQFRVSEIGEIAERFVDLANELSAFKEKIPPIP